MPALANMSFWNDVFIQLKEVNLLSTFVRITLAAVFGGIIGMERGRRRRAAGLRTHMLVCIGATLVMITNQYVSAEFGNIDPTRLGAQVISGIGFLGVGTIIVDRQQQVRGLTTAAGLWACACMGLALGIGFYSGAIISCVFIIGTITILNKLELFIINKSRVMEIYTEFESNGDLNAFLSALSESGIKIRHMENIRRHGDAGNDDARMAIIMTLQLPKRHEHSEVLAGLENISGLLLIEELR